MKNNNNTQQKFNGWNADRSSQNWTNVSEHVISSLYRKLDIGQIDRLLQISPIRED
ncbi:hypothetical protein [Methanolobus sp. ZRKC5]|uniref:hypothetical protein n=1 Tax=unclassified Methanolobus TaxID=2629569 RepID=UPI00313D8C39